MPREATLEFIAGSHEGTWYMPKTFLTEQYKWFPEGSLVPVPDVTSGAPRPRLASHSSPGCSAHVHARSAAGDHNVLGWELEPGDAVAFQ